MEKTIKEWFESVADDHLRQQLLENYDPTYAPDPERVQDCFYYALCYGFSWPTAKVGSLNYWRSIADKSLKGDIDFIEDGPREPTPQEEADAYRAAHESFRESVKYTLPTEVDEAIRLLKSRGYRIQKPVTTYEEV